MTTYQPTLNEALKEWALARRAYNHWMNNISWPTTMEPAARARFEANDMRISDRYNAAEEQLARVVARARRKRK